MRLFFTGWKLAQEKPRAAAGAASPPGENYCTLTGIVALMPPVPVIVTV